MAEPALDLAPVPDVLRHALGATTPDRLSALTDAVDLVAGRLAAGGRLVVVDDDPAALTRYRRELALPAAPADTAVTPRDAVVGAAPADPAHERRGAGVVAGLSVAERDAVALAVAAQLGHLHDTHPVDLVVDDTTRPRALAMVAAIAGVDEARAAAALAATGDDVRVAVVALALDLDVPTAMLHTAAHRTLRGALAAPPPTPRPPAG